MLAVVEGLPASGKSTLVNWLLEGRIIHHVIAEPTGFPSGGSVEALPAKLIEHLAAKYEESSLLRGRVLLDRGYPSLGAWDAAAEETETAHISSADELKSALVQGTLWEPDLYIWLDIAPEVSLRRRPRPKADSEPHSKLRGLAASQLFYRRFFGATPVPTITIDAAQPVALTMSQVAEFLAMYD